MQTSTVTIQDSIFNTQMAYENWISKYRYKDEKPIETFKRVAKELAKIEAPDRREYWEEKFFHAMVKVENGVAVGLKCTPGGRITSNAGAKDKNKGGKATLFNCFINGPVTNASISYSKNIHDEKISFKLKTSDSPDDLNNIFLTILEQAKTLASEGGYGINFDFIRPRGSVIRGTKIKHPGVVSYMNVWDTVAAMIIKGDNDGYADTLKSYLTEEEQEQWEAEFENLKKAPRKGAMMGCLTVSHPDIEEFVRAKQTPGVLTKFNISVVVTDEFMRAVAEDNLFELKFDGKVYKRIKARDLFDLIMTSTYNRAEPGILFYDNMQRNNPISYLGKVNATNPCFTGEMRLHTNKGLLTFRELYESGEELLVEVDNRVGIKGVLDPTKTGISIKPATPVAKTGTNQKILKITTSNSTILRVTPYHRFPTEKGFKTAQELKINDLLFTVENEKETKIVSIEEDGEEDVYCLNQPENESIIVNGVLTGNCGEIPGNPTISTTCLLGNLNLTAYVKKDRTFDYETFKEDVGTFSRLLDNVNDISYLPLPRYENAVKSLRQYGMGLNGLGSALIMMGIPYNSPEGIAFAEELSHLKENITMQTSALLAKEKGTFPYYSEEFLETEYFKSDRLTSETKNLIKKHGIRNAKTTTNPPNGNTSIICDIVSNGIEPVFMLEYERFRMVDEWPEGLSLDNVKTLLEEIKVGDAIAWRGEYKGSEYYFEPQNRGLCIVEPVRDYGYQWVLDNYPEDKKKKYLVTTEKLKVDDHISMQAAVQHYCNQSISKTINLPNDYKFENFKKVYIKGWEAGLIGVTTYRAGTMEAVIKEKDKKEEEKVKWDNVKLPKKFLNGATHVIKREGMKFYIHFSYLPVDVENKKPIAIWISSNHKPKHESTQTRKMISIIADLCKEKGVNPDIVDQYMEKIMKNDLHVRLAKIASLALRHNVTPKEIVEASRDIPNLDVTTLVYAVRKFLSAHIKNGTPVQGKVCENKKCRSTNLIYESGCIKCLDCGASGCD